MRTGVNATIGSDVRENAGGAATGSMTTRSGDTSLNATSTTRAGAQAAGGVKGAMGRTSNRGEGALENAGGATKRTVNCVKNSVSTTVGNASNCDPLTGKYARDAVYDRLFTRIVMRAPAPIGLGDV